MLKMLLTTLPLAIAFAFPAHAEKFFGVDFDTPYVLEGPSNQPTFIFAQVGFGGEGAFLAPPGPPSLLNQEFWAYTFSFPGAGITVCGSSVPGSCLNSQPNPAVVGMSEGEVFTAEFSYVSIGTGPGGEVSTLIPPSTPSAYVILPDGYSFIPEASVAAVPEMSTWAMLLIGLAALGAGRVCRSRSQCHFELSSKIFDAQPLC